MDSPVSGVKDREIDTQTGRQRKSRGELEGGKEGERVEGLEEGRERKRSTVCREQRGGRERRGQRDRRTDRQRDRGRDLEWC